MFLLFRCFEVNGCPGLYWYGQKACSKSLVASVIKIVTAFRENKTNLLYLGTVSTKVEVKQTETL